MSELSSELEGVQTPGTWRVSDGTAVPFKDATSAWAASAFDVLVGVASNYHSFITYKDLAEKVQASTGIRSRSQMRNWIGGELGKVVDRAAAEGLPSLTALCVKQDQSVGDGYRYVLEVAGLEVPEDLDQHAAEARLECYKYFGAAIPAEGGIPATAGDHYPATQSETSTRTSCCLVSDLSGSVAKLGYLRQSLKD